MKRKKPKKRPPDPVFGQEALLEMTNNCSLREDFKPLRWQGKKDYLKAIWDPE